MKKRISDMMDCIHDADLELNEATPLSSQRIKELTMNKITNKRKTHRRTGFRVLGAAAVIVTLTVTAFAADNIAGWFRQYFEKQTQEPLTPSQIEFIEENEQVIAKTQKHNGYSLELKSVIADKEVVYVTIGLTAPEGTTHADLAAISTIGVDLYDSSNSPGAAYSLAFHDDMDGLENTIDMVLDMKLADWNEGSKWTLRIDSLSKEIYDEEYEQELRGTKYAGQTDFMFTDEEMNKMYQFVTLAEGPWKFDIDLSNANNGELELITTPVAAQSYYRFEPYEVIPITSFILRPLSATIKADTEWVPSFCDNVDNLIYVVMKDGSQVKLLSQWGTTGMEHLNAESPIVLDEVDHILLADGTKIMVP